MKENIGGNIIGKDGMVELLLVAMLSDGHVLIEDVPGNRQDDAGCCAGPLALDLSSPAFSLAHPDPLPRT